jgi:hypothetical protein
MHAKGRWVSPTEVDASWENGERFGGHADGPPWEEKSGSNALRHAPERCICSHLYGTQMTPWEAERAKFCGTISRSVVTCSSSLSSTDT